MSMVTRVSTFGLYFLVYVPDVERLFGGGLCWWFLLDLLFADHGLSLL
jgi:hypothetical protein